MQKENLHELIFEFLSRYIELTEIEKRAIAKLEIFKSVKKGEVLLSEGQKSKVGYFVLKGCLRTFYIKDGEEKTTGFYTEFEPLTPPCILDSSPSAFYIDCLEDSLITAAQSENDEKLFQSFPRFETLCRIVSDELIAKKQSNLDEFRISSPEERYLSLLNKRPDLIQRVPQYHLASYLGMRPQSLSRLKARIKNK